MAQVIAKGTCSITRLRTGDTVYVTFTTNGATCIFYDDVKVITDFTKNPLTITPHVASMKGNSFVVKEHKWEYNGTNVAQQASLFQVDANTGALTIKGNFMTDVKNMRNVIFTWSGKVESQGSIQSVSKSIEITAISAGNNSYWGTILADGSTILDNDNESITLRTKLSQGGNPLAFGTKYWVKWEYENEDGVQQTSISETLTINRSNVNGSSVVTCYFYSDSGLTTQVEGDAITIIDKRDEWQVVVDDSYSVATDADVTITPKLLNVSTQEFKNATSWDCEVRNNYTEAKIPISDYTFANGVFTMNESKMYYQNSGVKTEYSPQIIFTAHI